MARAQGFSDFVAARTRALLRTAWLLTGDWQLAEDLVQTSLAKTYLAWGRIRANEQAEAYVRRVMVTTYATWWRRRWHGEVPTEVLPELVGTSDGYSEIDTRESVRRALAGLPRRQRAALVLRYYEDLTEAQTADVLGCSIGTVKTHTSRALAALRESSALADLVNQEPVP